jgi:uncharacterized membrane protein
MVVLVVALFVVTIAVDQAAATGRLALPDWVESGTADTVRQILVAIAAAVITVAGMVFSITILVLQLASQQFGPRMLRNFIRDRGTQFSLGAFVATFVYAMLVLASVSDPPRAFIPHLSAMVAVGFTLIDLGVLIYYIDHVATSIQLSHVVDGIARDFRWRLASVRADAQRGHAGLAPGDIPGLEGAPELVGQVTAAASGFIQAVGHEPLVEVATAADAVIRLLHRPGYFVLEGQPVALVTPSGAVDEVSGALAAAYIVGPNRTLTQDPSLAIDQLVEVAIRALSPAVNDTFTALNCIDWLGDCLTRACEEPLPSGVYRDATGKVRVIEPAVTAEQLIKEATDKIRQASRGMPAVQIGLLQNLEKVMAVIRTPGQREAVLHHAEMILNASEESVPETSDRQDVRAAYDAVVAMARVAWEG